MGARNSNDTMFNICSGFRFTIRVILTSPGGMDEQKRDGKDARYVGC